MLTHPLRLSQVQSEMQSFEGLEPLDAIAISQTILELAEPALASGARKDSSAETGGSASVVDAMQRLVALIQTLRSPDSGWSATVPQTPETIAPYVMEEACDLLEALQSMPLDEVNPTVERSSPVTYRAIAELAPWLLWGVARSSYDVMHLMEGTPVQARRRSQDWQTGFLRLVAILEVEGQDSSVAFDLATFQPCQFLLDAEAQVQATDCSLCQEPTSLNDLLPSLVQHIQRITPAIGIFFEGLHVEALVPKRGWQSVTIRLQLGLEFTPMSEDLNPTITDEFTEAIASAHWLELDDSILSATTGAVAVSNPLIQFTDADWVERYVKTLIRQQLTSALPTRFSRQRFITRDEDTHPKPLLAQIIQDACEIADWLEHPFMRSRCLQAHQETILQRLLRQLLWGLNRSAYEVMQLLVGVRASVLQPEWTWQTGILRLSAQLMCKTPEFDWTFDLATGQFPQPSPFPLDVSGIVQSDEQDWCCEPITIESLKATVLQQLMRCSPEIALLMEGTVVDLSEGDRQWYPGILQLNLNFEFIPISS